MAILRYCDGKAYSHDCKAVNFGASYLRILASYEAKIAKICNF